MTARMSIGARVIATGAALGHKIPPTLLAAADEGIE